MVTDGIVVRSIVCRVDPPLSHSVIQAPAEGDIYTGLGPRTLESGNGADIFYFKVMTSYKVFNVESPPVTGGAIKAAVGIGVHGQEKRKAISFSIADDSI